MLSFQKGEKDIIRQNKLPFITTFQNSNSIFVCVANSLYVFILFVQNES